MGLAIRLIHRVPYGGLSTLYASILGLLSQAYKPTYRRIDETSTSDFEGALWVERGRQHSLPRCLVAAHPLSANSGLSQCLEQVQPRICLAWNEVSGRHYLNISNTSLSSCRCSQVERKQKLTPLCMAAF